MSSFMVYYLDCNNSSNKKSPTCGTVCNNKNVNAHMYIPKYQHYTHNILFHSKAVYKGEIACANMIYD